MTSGAERKDVFARQLEGWIQEVIKEKANGANEKIPLEIRQAFQRTIQANILYHHDMANMLKNLNDHHSLESYHNLMADVYQTFL